MPAECRSPWAPLPWWHCESKGLRNLLAVCLKAFRSHHHGTDFVQAAV